MGRQVIVLQDDRKNILAVEGSLKKIASSQGSELLSYRQLQRLHKKAREAGEGSFSFLGKGESRKEYVVSWWEI